MADEVLDRRERAALNIAVRSRNYRRARERALTALARKHKEDYLELLEIEKAKDEQEGKVWSSIAGVDIPGNLDTSANYANKNRRNSATNPQDEGDQE